MLLMATLSAVSPFELSIWMVTVSGSFPIVMLVSDVFVWHATSFVVRSAWSSMVTCAVPVTNTPLGVRAGGGGGAEEHAAAAVAKSRTWAADRAFIKPSSLQLVTLNLNQHGVVFEYLTDPGARSGRDVTKYVVSGFLHEGAVDSFGGGNPEERPSFSTSF